MGQTSLTVNGRRQLVDADPDTPLLYVLRNDLRLNGPKFGCGLAQCGACTIIMDGKTIRSCVTPLRVASNRTITTLEGLGSTIPVPAAIANAIFDAVGVRLREGPFTPKRLLEGLKRA
jgi:nicotinate dehydrogenase subunit A